MLHGEHGVTIAWPIVRVVVGVPDGRQLAAVPRARVPVARLPAVVLQVGGWATLTHCTHRNLAGGERNCGDEGVHAATNVQRGQCLRNLSFGLSLFSVSQVTECQLILSAAAAAADLFPKLCFFFEKQCVVDISLLKGILSWISIVRWFTRINSIEGCILHDCRAEGASPVWPVVVPGPPHSRPVIDVVGGGSQSQPGPGRPGGGGWWRHCQAVRAGLARLSCLSSSRHSSDWRPTTGDHQPPGERQDAHLPPGRPAPLGWWLLPVTVSTEKIPE